MNSKQEKLNGVFDQLQETGKCRTKKDFAAMLGVSYTGLTRAMNGDEQYLTNSLIAKAVGLLAVPEPVPQEDGSAPDRVPLIPYEARGGLIGDFVDGVHGYDCEMVISPIKGVDFAMTVTGDSMMPEYNPGDRILISLGMGHRTAGNKVTAIYIKRNMKKVDEANRKVMDYVLGITR